MPSIEHGGKVVSWSDEGYDEIDYLIDNDPIELGRKLRLALSTIAAICDKGERFWGAPVINDVPGELVPLLPSGRTTSTTERDE